MNDMKKFNATELKNALELIEEFVCTADAEVCGYDWTDGEEVTLEYALSTMLPEMIENYENVEN